MKRRKIGISILIICLFVLTYAFSATAAPVYIESRLYYYPKSIVDNKSQAIDLSSDTKYLTTASYNNDGITLLTSPNNLAIFRISENLMPHKSVYQSVSDKVTTGVDLVVTSQTNWEFVKEDNPTQRVSFSLDAFCTQYIWNSNQNKYVADNPVAIPHTFENNSEGSNNSWGGWGNSNTTITSTKSTSGNVCTILMPYTPVATSVSTHGNVTMYARIPKYKRDFDICVHITGDTSNLPQGYYYTTLSYSVSGYYESPVVFKDGNQVSLPGNNDPSSVEGTITIWAYIGDVLNGFNDYSFSVSPAADTYSMVLGKTDAQPTAPSYDVASVHFYYLNQVNTAPNQSVQAQKFKIYISPTADYTATGHYRFIKMNTEGQTRNDKNTIYYDLGLNTSRGFRTFSNLSGATLLGDIGTAGVYSNNTYVITPKYSSVQTAASSSYTYNKQTIIVGEDCFTQSWILDQEIYLKVTDESYDANHLAGMYYSWIYLTLVVD